MGDEGCRKEFHDRTAGVAQQILRENGLVVINAVLAGILVGIGVYGPRYRHRAFIRVLFLGATTLFLPILSYVASNATSTSTLDQTRTFACFSDVRAMLILCWACLVQIVGINTCALVAADNNREGRNMGLPVAIVVRAVWVSYLVVSISRDIDGASIFFLFGNINKHLVSYLFYNILAALALVFTKMAL